MDEAAFEEFKWEILGDAAFEDWQMTFEPLGLLRTKLPEMDDLERQAIAERVLRELFAEGRVYFFRTAPHLGDRREASDDPASRLSAEDVDRLLSGSDWRTVPLGPQGAGVEFGATPEGEAAARAHWPADV